MAQPSFHFPMDIMRFPRGVEFDDFDGIFRSFGFPEADVPGTRALSMQYVDDGSEADVPGTMTLSMQFADGGSLSMTQTVRIT